MTQTRNAALAPQSAFDAYMARARKFPLLTGPQEVELAKAIKAGGAAGERARQTMITSNLRFVVSMAWRQVRENVTLEDLVQEANIGLMKAVEKFDETRGFRFATYARWWIMQSMRTFLDENGFAVKLPARSAFNIGKMNKVVTKLSRGGNKPTETEVAREMGVDVELVRSLAEWSRAPIAMSSPIFDGDGEFGDRLEDKTAVNPEAAAIEQDFNAKIWAALDKLSEKQRQVIILRFGLDGKGVRTLEEISQIYGCTREWIRQIEDKALGILGAGSSGRTLGSFR